MNDDPEMGV